MHIGMGRGAEDVTMVKESLRGRSMVDIVSGPQV